MSSDPIDRAGGHAHDAHAGESGGRIDPLTSGIVHDFNNHLAGIVGCLHMMRAEIDKANLDGVGRYIDAAQGAARRATSLTRRLLDVARQVAGEAEPTDLGCLVRGMEVPIRLAVGLAVRIELQIDSSPATAWIDPAQLEPRAAFSTPASRRGTWRAVATAALPMCLCRRA